MNHSPTNRTIIDEALANQLASALIDRLFQAPRPTGEMGVEKKEDASS